MHLNKITEELVKGLKHNKEFKLNDFIEKLTARKLEKILRDLSNEYYNTGKLLLSDEIFDYLKDKLKEKDSNNDFLHEVGAPVETKEKVKLPYSMGSLSKIKPSTQELDKWKLNYHGLYVVSDKLDGISAQLYITKNKIQLFTRGDGEYGQDISHLINYLFDTEKIAHIKKKITDEISIRGELILSKNNFASVKDKFKNARNAVAGFINAKKIDKTLSKMVEFVAYTVITPEMTQEEQMKFLKSCELIKKVVKYHIYDSDKLTNENLSKYLEKRRKESEYEIDGIVVFDSSRVYEHTIGDPEHGFAFKAIMSDQYAEALVIDVLWNASMDGYLKPRVQINPINLVGVTITYATAFHAKFVEEHKLGPGSVIKIIRSGDVIPDILEVLKPSLTGKPKMPDTKYIWDKNHVNIMVKDKHKGEYANIIKAKRMDHFFSEIGVKNLSIGILTKLVDNNYDNVISILEADKNELSKIDGLGKNIVNKIFENINEAMKKATLEKIMSGSHVFGTGVGERKIKQITKAIPNILEIEDKNELKELVLNINGFSDITANKFVNNLNKFKIFYEQLKEIYNFEHKQQGVHNKNGIFNGKKVVFTGFRDNQIKEYIENMGGTVSSSVSSKTNMLIYADTEKTHSKLTKAKELNIEIISKSEFIKKYLKA